MSNGKTINVMEGDTWTIGPDRGIWIYQYRGGKWRGISPDVVESYWCSQAKLDGEVDLSKTVALAILRGYGYHLTTGEGEKCQQKTTSPVLTAERTEKPAPVTNQPHQDFPTANGGKAGLDNVQTVKPDVTVDAIEVDVTVAIARINGLAKWIEDLESRLAALAAAPKPTARVVKAPTFAPSRVFSDAEQAVIGELHRKWYAALTSQGFTIADEGSSK